MGDVSGVKCIEFLCKGVALTLISRIWHHISALNEDSGGTTSVNIKFPRFVPDSSYHPLSNGLNMNLLTLMISSYSTSTTISQLTFDEKRYRILV